MAWVRIDDVEQACQLREAGLLWRHVPRWHKEYVHIDGGWWSAGSIRAHWEGTNLDGAHFCILVEE